MGGYGSGWHRPRKWKIEGMVRIRTSALPALPADDGTPLVVVGGTEWGDGTKLEFRTELTRNLRAGFRGTRPAFLCPRCGRVRLVLYAGHPEGHPTGTGKPVTGCRACLPLIYRIQAESKDDRACNVVRRLAKRLDDARAERGTVAHGKPRYWRWSRYARLIEAHNRADEAWMMSFIQGAERLDRAWKKQRARTTRRRGGR
jgi:hypothetical protein